MRLLGGRWRYVLWALGGWVAWRLYAGHRAGFKAWTVLRNPFVSLSTPEGRGELSAFEILTATEPTPAEKLAQLRVKP